MATLLRSYRLKNGLVVTILDDTQQYYADFHNVRLTMRVEVPVKEEWLAPFKGREHYEAIAEGLRQGVTYEREVVKAGIEGKRLAEVKGQVVGSFEENTLPYFGRDGFPEKYVQERFREMEEELRSGRKPGRRKGPPPLG